MEKTELEKDVSNLTSLILQSRDIIKTAKGKEECLILAEDIIAANLNIGRHFILAEQEYELLKTFLIAEGKSAAASESEAKTKPCYYNFKRTRQLYEMGEESIRILKHAGNY